MPDDGGWIKGQLNCTDERFVIANIKLHFHPPKPNHLYDSNAIMEKYVVYIMAIMNIRIGMYECTRRGCKSTNWIVQIDITKRINKIIILNFSSIIPSHPHSHNIYGILYIQSITILCTLGYILIPSII